MISISEKINTLPTDFDPSVGAYPTDYAEGIVPLDDQNKPIDPTGTLAARGDGDISFHDPNSNILFGQEDYRNPDAATGLAATPESEFASEDIHIVEAAQLGLGREATIGLDPHDAAARWLAENDPDYLPPAETDKEDL